MLYQLSGSWDDHRVLISGQVYRVGWVDKQ